jgi:beta-glucosidase
MASDEVVEFYLSDLEAGGVVPKWSLRGTKRVSLDPGEKRSVYFKLDASGMAMVGEDGKYYLEPGTFRVYLGGSQPDRRSVELTGQTPLSAEFVVKGEKMRC